ncbi:PD-(D/E)XK nuclease family transposase [Butyrivibrio sp. YAB3001]|uniref:PD-(D/E)XK nuclease family transposase n=1 Tax=Butyrivibrio sp. YAB3001 TaxID=1520812 RepID=UPI0008F6417C|nr:PD-(D/E)XK nuclease family transposase [Butyrivibrio sp. YAB3001]SFB88767.1 conserved hypothetical protein (putative transposase or invertase) [Butyrivibrio sp. YAB3001]
MHQQTNILCEPIYINATGVIEYTLTSDLLFHYVMQKSKRALIGLVCSLKGISPSLVKDILVLNPIELNGALKETVMDLMLLLNNGEIINIELQMYTDKFWIPRSVLYLCRAYDCLNEGEDYSLLKPTTHFCITNQAFFPEYPEFYSHYLLLNTKNHHPYTKNFGINVLQLNQIELATDEDISSGLVYWAKLFNATTWEEFKSLAQENEATKEVGNLMYTINSDTQAKAILEGQRRYREQMASQYAAGLIDAAEKYEHVIQEKDDTIAEQKSTINEQASTIELLKAELAKYKEKH